MFFLFQNFALNDTIKIEILKYFSVTKIRLNGSI